MLGETVLASGQSGTVIIDEFQLIPALLNEVQWLITNKQIQFILSGSSPGKILRSGANFLGVRCLHYELYPLIYKEIPDFNLIRALNHGLLPRHYLSKNPEKLISAYISRFLPSYQKRPKRRVIQSPEFYYFDIGTANYLLKRKSIEPGSENFG